MLCNLADFPPLPLTAQEFQPIALPSGLLSTPPEQLFPDARDAKAALAGFLLLSGHWDLSHQLSQDTPSREGSYWHAIAHRLEPDSWNAGYWLRRVGDHPIYPELRAASAPLLAPSGIGWRLAKQWNPHEFLMWCDEARNLPGSAKHSAACQIQRLECNLLLSWCIMKTKDF